MKHQLRRRYYHIKDRCYNPNNKAYKRYGGRGIKMCDEWFNDYFSFEKWALENGYKPELQIDRVDNDGNYCPENCKFVTNKENSQHKCSTRYFTLNGKTQNLTQWCEEMDMPRATVATRIDRYGWDFERAITTRPIKRDKHKLDGKRFGRLTVIEYSHDNGQNSFWKCKCDCGNEITIKDCKLITGHTKSCGCYQREVVSKRMLENNHMKKKN